MGKKQTDQTNILIRLVWMIFIGWWLAIGFYIVGAILTALIITAPLGMLVVQKIGWAFSLYKPEQYTRRKETHFLVRFIYFFFIGWWAGGVALTVAIIAGITIIGLPLTFFITNRLGLIMTLAS